MVSHICWNENFKIRLASCDDSMMLHDVIKLMLVKKILKKNSRDRNFLRIYTEYPIEEINCRADIYFENIKTKEAFAYEIQKNDTKKWGELKKKQYKDWNVFGFNSSDLIIVPIKDAPKELDELNKWLDKYIF
jgi:hypothetical protein